MKAERTEPKQVFVPVIVTLESQAEVDALHAVTNHIRITSALPALNHWWDKLNPFVSSKCNVSWDKLNIAIR